MSNSIRQLPSVLAAFREVEFSYLFGSRAQNRATPRSDTDVAVYFKSGISSKKRFALRLKLIGQLMDTLHDDRVDLVDLADATLALRFRAVQPAHVLYSRNERERIRFEVATMSEYFDRLPLIQRSSDRYFKQVAKHGIL